jgi:hypothetical protein
MIGTKDTLTASGYRHLYNDTRSMITVLSGLTRPALDDAATELKVDYELFCADYRGPYLVDAYVGFAEMLRQWSVPWPAMEGSALNGLTAAQFSLIWAWEQNNTATYCLGGEAVANGWEPGDAMNCGVIAAVSAAKSLFHAKSLLASDGNKMGQLPELLN